MVAGRAPATISFDRVAVTPSDHWQPALWSRRPAARFAACDRTRDAHRTERGDRRPVGPPPHDGFSATGILGIHFEAWDAETLPQSTRRS